MFLPGPSKSFILYTCMVHSHNLCKWEAGSRGAYLKIENGDDPIFDFFLSGNKFASMHVSMMRMCH